MHHPILIILLIALLIGGVGFMFELLWLGLIVAVVLALLGGAVHIGVGTIIIVLVLIWLFGGNRRNRW